MHTNDCGFYKTGICDCRSSTSPYLEQAKECIKLYRPTYSFDEKSTVEAIALAIKSAVEAEREANCRLVCKHCANNIPMAKPSTFTGVHEFEVGVYEQCQAQAIRQRSKEEGSK